jgi:SAM-dependent methyltransferase
MSRLDAPIEPTPTAASGDERPSIPGSPARGRRRRGSTLRVPDDAIPAGTPPPAPVSRRSVPPPPVGPEVIAIRPGRMITIGDPTPLPIAPIAPIAASFFAPVAPEPQLAPQPEAFVAPAEPAPAPIASEPPPPAPEPLPPPVAAATPEVEDLAPNDIVEIPSDSVVGMTLLTGDLPGRPRSAPPPPVRASTPPPPPPRNSTPPPPPIRIATPPPMVLPPELAALGLSPRLATPPPMAVPPELAALVAQATAGPLPASSAMAAQQGVGQEIAPPAPAPLGADAKAKNERLRTPTFENLEDQVREALQLLDGDEFEAPAIDVALDEETTSPSLRAVSLPDEGPPSGEEALADEELVELSAEEVSAKKPNAPPPRRLSGPAPASGAPSQPTLVASISKPPPPTRPDGLITGERPALVVAAAASVSTPAAPAVAPPPTSVQVSSSADTTGEIKRKKRQWFEELFNDDFARTVPKSDPRWLKRELDFIEESMGLAKGAAMLDLGCGPGVHAVQLAKRGYEVIGIDLSLAMLARASDEAAEHQQRINFVQGDMRELTFEDAFDGVLCWGTTFGYFDEQKNADVVQKIHRSLRKHGRLLLDVVNRDYVVPRSPSMVWFEGDGCVCMDEAQFDAINSRLKVKRTLMMEDGRSREIDYSIRLYALHELGKLLHDNGFRVAEVSGETSTPGKFFNAESARILILAEKR